MKKGVNIRKNKSFKKRKYAQSGVITIVLLILLVLASIVLVWNIVLPLLKNASEEVNTDIFSLEFKNGKFQALYGGQNPLL